jgi:hypothetical protein
MSGSLSPLLGTVQHESEIWGVKTQELLILVVKNGENIGK